MQAKWQIGSIFGIPLYIDPSWLIILAVFTFANEQDLQAVYPELGQTLAWGLGFLTAILLFGSVLLHELGHSLVARSQGIKVSSITLFLFGGIASIDRESPTPGLALQVAIAGPAVSLTLFALLTAIAYPLPDSSTAQFLVKDIASINLVLALFNLIPGLPLDGGQILKAVVWKIKGDRFQGVHWAARTGKILGWTAIILGVIFSTYSFSFLWFALIGWFVVRNATTYDRITNIQEILLQLTAADGMTRDFRVIDADMTLRQFADDYILQAAEKPQIYFAASDGRYRGLVSVEEFRGVERSQWEIQTVHSIVKPLNEIDTVEEKTTLAQAIVRLQNDRLPRVTVLSPAGTVAGILDRGDILRAMAQKLNINISEGEIKRLKEEGSYPPGLPIFAIAEAALDSQTTEISPSLPTQN